ncbi:MAG: hypothetical protein GEU78_12210 [Actinobacteria bacterium]|nr:hypothetical protein [Actinomycetota bacterium]
MRRLGALIGSVTFVAAFLIGGMALADGPSGSKECHVADDDCDGTIDEDTGGIEDDEDGDGLVDEDPVGDANGDGDPDDDGDGLVDEDVPDDDGDGLVDEDPAGDALDDPGENQVDCNEANSTDVGGVGYAYAGTNGLEACADESSSLPVDGRATIDVEDGYVAIDGDNSNQSPANGYARVDGDGLHCGSDANQDSDTADQSGNTSSDCG